eukprot:c14479_g1_i1 orf=1-426(-)
MALFVCTDSFLLHVAFVMFAIFQFSSGKECTNIPTQLLSHSLRMQFQSSRVPTSLTESPNSANGCSSKESQTILQSGDDLEFDQIIQQNPAHPSGQSFLKEVSLHSITLDSDSLQGRAQETNLRYLLILDVDSLVWSFRKTA